MASESLNIIKDIAAIILMVAGATLCVVLSVAVAKVFPSLRRSMLNLEKFTGSAAETGPNIVSASENVKEITGNLVGAAKDISESTPSLRRSTLNLEKFTGSAAETGPNIVSASENVKEITGNLVGAAKDISESTPSLRRSTLNLEKFTESAAEAGPNIVAASENVREITVNVLSASEDIAAATPVLQWLGPAGKAANIANTGLGRLAGFLRGLFRG